MSLHFMDDVVQVSVWWEASREVGSAPALIALERAEEGKRLYLGEAGDLFLPASALGDERVELVERSRGATIVTVPRGARAKVDGAPRAEPKLLLERGNTAELAIGSFRVRIEHGAGEVAAPGKSVLERLRSPGAGCIAGSALFHVSVFAAVSLVAPSLAAAEADSLDRDRLALMQRMLDASAQRELERPIDEAPASDGEAGQPAAAAMGAQGEAGRPDTSHEGRLAIRGNARPTDVTTARERALADSASLVVSAFASLNAGDPNAPVTPWGSVAEGSDDVSKAGHLFDRTIDDAAGSGGLSMSGREQGGGGTANAIGLHGFGPLGSMGTCAGPGPCTGIGNGRGGKLGSGRVSHFKGPRYGTPETNGRLAAEIIQRIVRLNDGRYRFCYENGLRNDPSLHGRVTVKFMIDRSGAVAVAADGGSDIPDEAVRRCVVSSFLGLSFPQPDNGTVTVVYPIVFSPE
jgi:hypothetical protein